MVLSLHLIFSVQLYTIFQNKKIGPCAACQRNHIMPPHNGENIFQPDNCSFLRNMTNYFHIFVEALWKDTKRFQLNERKLLH